MRKSGSGSFKKTISAFDNFFCNGMLHKCLASLFKIKLFFSFDIFPIILYPTKKQDFFLKIFIIIIMEYACSCKDISYHQGARFCHACGRQVTIKQLLDCYHLNEFCEGCTKDVPQDSEFCFRCGKGIKLISKKEETKQKEMDSYVLIGEALLRSSGASSAELKVLSKLLLARFPKGDCQLVHIASTNIGFQVSGQHVVTGISAVLLLATHYTK